jgi:SAM-dependent methyltransferase
MNRQLNRLLQTRAEVDVCTQWLRDSGLRSHDFTCKDFDQALITPLIQTTSSVLDMGSQGSFILDNLKLNGHIGKKCGIDLGYQEGEKHVYPEIELFKGSLMSTPFADESFDVITNLSVVEHEVSYQAMAKECARLLRKGGNLYITHDYWSPRVDTLEVSLYGLKWTILDKPLTEELIAACEAEGLHQSSPMDWTTSEQVINPQFCAPYGKSYTFAILHFIKN